MSNNENINAELQTPLVMKRDTLTVFQKLLSSIYHELKQYLVNTDTIKSNPSFFATGNKILSSDKKKIADHAVVAIKQLKKVYSNVSWEEGVRRLGDILLTAKFQSLAFYIKNKEKPVQLDQVIDKCLNLLVNQTLKLKSNGQANVLFGSLLALHYTIATQQIYKDYLFKLTTFQQNHVGDDLTLAAFNRYNQQLDAYQKAFIEGINHFSTGLLDPMQPLIVKADLLPEIIAFLNEQSSKLLNLEPTQTDLNIADISSVYMWAVTAVSKLTAYVRNLNDQLFDASSSSENTMGLS